MIDGWCISGEIALRWKSLDLIDDDTAPLVQVMALCRQTASHYLSQCWHRSVSLYGVTRLQWVSSFFPRQYNRHFGDDIIKCIFMSEKCCIWIQISLKLVTIVAIDDNCCFMYWPGAEKATSYYLKQCSSLTHIFGNRGRWVNRQNILSVLWDYIFG